jgi:hypothetical protein
VALACLTLALPVWPQTLIDASQRQTKATDFTPVTLPPIDPSLLQGTVAVTRPASPAKPDIELQYDAKPMDFVYSYDTMFIRGITVKNNGPYTELMCDIAVTGSDGFSWAAGATGNRVYGMNLYLQPGESQSCWFEGNWNELGQPSWKTLGATYDYRLDFRVCPTSPNGFSVAPCNNRPYTQTATLHNNVRVAFLPPAPTTGMTDHNATISGRVYDAKTGAALGNVHIRAIPAGQGFYDAGPDNSGNYKFNVTAHLAAMQGIWQNF